MKENSKKQLTVIQAFGAMQDFLEGYYKQTSSDNIGSLLGDMLIIPSGMTADIAAWSDWCNSIEKIANKIIMRKKILGNENEYLTIMEAFRVMQDFLDGYVERTSSEDIAEIVNEMQAIDSAESDSALWKRWCASVEWGRKNSLQVMVLKRQCCNACS